MTLVATSAAGIPLFELTMESGPYRCARSHARVGCCHLTVTRNLMRPFGQVLGGPSQRLPTRRVSGWIRGWGRRFCRGRLGEGLAQHLFLRVIQGCLQDGAACILYFLEHLVGSHLLDEYK